MNPPPPPSPPPLSKIKTHTTTQLKTQAYRPSIQLLPLRLNLPKMLRLFRLDKLGFLVVDALLAAEEISRGGADAWIPHNKLVAGNHD